MSWDRWEYNKYSKCACGKGKVIAHCWHADDDWNRSESGINSIEISCHDCSKSYHVETVHRYSWCPSWIGSGNSSRYYLVPNNIKIPSVITKKNDYDFYDAFEEQLAGQYTKVELYNAIDDMQENKYSTRVKLNISKSIIYKFSKAKNTKSLKNIIPQLKSILKNYDSFTWTKTKIEKFREEEEKIIADNEEKIAQAISKSYELDFKKEI